MNSVDFKTSLFNVKVQRKDDKAPMTYYDYLMNEQKEPWWSGFFGLLKPEREKEQPVNTFELTKEQEKIAKAIAENVVCTIDKKTNVITIEVTDQDPLISATMADSVRNRLQNFITEYRTKKARNDLAYMERLFAEAREQYVKARQQYASFSDTNQDLMLQTFKSKQDDLENDMQLKYNAYTQIYEQLQLSKAKVQERTPAFTVVQSASVPIKHINKSKLSVLILSMFLGAVAYILFLVWKKRRQVFIIR
jgi:uncharacterized protein involved in exopolysaccharide biosynthesis